MCITEAQKDLQQYSCDYRDEYISEVKKKTFYLWYHLYVESEKWFTYLNQFYYKWTYLQDKKSVTLKVTKGVGQISYN